MLGDPIGQVVLACLALAAALALWLVLRLAASASRQDDQRHPDVPDRSQYGHGHVRKTPHD